MPTKFTRTRDGATRTRMAYSAADAVQLRFEGWTEVNPVVREPSPVYADGSTAEPKPRDEPAADADRPAKPIKTNK